MGPRLSGERPQPLPRGHPARTAQHPGLPAWERMHDASLPLQSCRTRHRSGARWSRLPITSRCGLPISPPLSRVMGIAGVVRACGGERRGLQASGPSAGIQDGGRQHPKPHARALDSSPEPGTLHIMQSASVPSPRGGQSICDTADSHVPTEFLAMPRVSAPWPSFHSRLVDAPGTGLDVQSPCSPCSKLSQCRVTRKTGLWWCAL